MLLDGHHLRRGGAVPAGDQHLVAYGQGLVVGAVVVHPLPSGEPHPAEGVHGLVRGRQRRGKLEAMSVDPDRISLTEAKEQVKLEQRLRLSKYHKA